MHIFADTDAQMPQVEKTSQENEFLVPRDFVENDSILMISNKAESTPPPLEHHNLKEDQSPPLEIKPDQTLEEPAKESNLQLLISTSESEESIQSEMYEQVDSSCHRVKKSADEKTAESLTNEITESPTHQTEEDEEDMQTEMVTSQSGKSTSSKSSSRKSSISSLDQNELRGTSALTKWSSQQRLIILVDEKNPSEDGTATNITTDCDSTTIITITTAASSRYNLKGIFVNEVTQ